MPKFIETGNPFDDFIENIVALLRDGKGELGIVRVHNDMPSIAINLGHNVAVALENFAWERRAAPVCWKLNLQARIRIFLNQINEKLDNKDLRIMAYKISKYLNQFGSLNGWCNEFQVTTGTFGTDSDGERVVLAVMDMVAVCSRKDVQVPVADNQ